METTSARESSDLYRSPSGGGGGGGGGGNRRFGGVQFSPSSFMQAPISALLEYTGVLRPVASRLSHSESESLISGGDVGSAVLREHGSARTDDPGASGSGGGGEVSIRIIGLGDQDNPSVGGGDGAPRPLPAVVSGRERSVGGGNGNGVVAEQNTVIADRADVDGENGGAREGISPSPSYASSDGSLGAEGDAGNTTTGANRDGAYQRYDIQQVARWIEQILPFSLLLLVVFIRQHLQGFFVTIWIAAVMFKSNDVLRKQTALKGERKICVLVAFAFAFTLHVVGVYWWYRNDDLIYPLFMFPPKVIPPFWHAIFIIMVNDTMVRQAAMVVKCMLLMYYKNTRGRNHRRQGQMLTLVEYFLLLYRALLPAPVWYRFFLNKEYGSLFSSLTTGLYLTFKLTSVVEKVQSFVTAFRALSCREVQYGSHATSEQVIAAGDLCATNHHYHFLPFSFIIDDDTAGTDRKKASAMRMSCNGCRVLRKGCSEDCTIRPCLQWIKTPEAQGNATVFLAKFYGRAGLLNLISAGPDQHRPAIFRSLLYEACGRIVNPIYGSVGLLWSGNRQLCQAAVEAVLKGEPIVQIPTEKATAISMPPLKSFDIRHVAKNTTRPNASGHLSHNLNKSSQTPFKRSGSTGSSNANRRRQREKSSGVHHDHHHESGGGATTSSSASGSMISAETVEPSTPERRMTSPDEVELDLTLGLGSSATANKHSSSSWSPDQVKSSSEGCKVDHLALFLMV